METSPLSPVDQELEQSILDATSELPELQYGDEIVIAAQLLGSLLMFTRCFYKLVNGREFIVRPTISRESHIITLCRELTAVFRLKTKRLCINIPPGHFKSTLMAYFVAWAWARYPDCNFLYISHSHDLATKHTTVIKDIIETSVYKKLFNVSLHPSFQAKDNFKTTAGGAVRAYGLEGPITGQDAGFAGCDRFSGAALIDDAHKPKEVFSDTIREGVCTNFTGTLEQRLRSPNVPIVFLGQRLHEIDLPGRLISGTLDGEIWKTVILKAHDEYNNVLCPMVITHEKLMLKKELDPYNYYSQYQQEPQPAGGGIFRREKFVLLDEEPKMIATFITADTAETDKTYNDATVFSFWGLYKIEQVGVETDLYGLHWLDCLEIRIEPKDLKQQFQEFYAGCMRHDVKPKLAAIEKKSTGTTLLSVLQDFRGLDILGIDRTHASGSKTARYFECQPYVAAGQVSLLKYAKHTEDCLEHCRKITVNNTHAHDDIADTLYDAIKLSLIDKTLIRMNTKKSDTGNISKELAIHFNKQRNKGATASWRQ